MQISIWLVTISGFINGLNPCAWAVMLFFIAFLFSMGNQRKLVFSLGLTYLSAVFLTYFLIGLGFLTFLPSLAIGTLTVKISAFLIILLGLASLKEAFFPRRWPSLRLGHLTKKYTLNWMKNVGYPSTALLGVIIAALSFSCSGGIYLAILSLLSSQKNYFSGVLYLIWYNLMAVLPLLIILILANNRLITEKLTYFQEKNDRLFRSLIGVLLLGLGIFILMWYNK